MKKLKRPNSNGGIARPNGPKPKQIICLDQAAYGFSSYSPSKTIQFWCLTLKQQRFGWFIIYFIVIKYLILSYIKING
jgi:hypothetical protein